MKLIQNLKAYFYRENKNCNNDITDLKKRTNSDSYIDDNDLRLCCINKIFDIFPSFEWTIFKLKPLL